MTIQELKDNIPFTTSANLHWALQHADSAETVATLRDEIESARTHARALLAQLAELARELEVL